MCHSKMMSRSQRGLARYSPLYFICVNDQLRSSEMKTSIYAVRYGDALNPWGDVIAMARSHCLLKPGGQALVGVPTGPKDILLFNAARVYGPIMYAHLFANWKQVYTEMTPEDFSTGCPWCYQPLYIVEKE